MLSVNLRSLIRGAPETAYRAHLSDGIMEILHSVGYDLDGGIHDLSRTILDELFRQLDFVLGSTDSRPGTDR